MAEDKPKKRKWKLSPEGRRKIAAAARRKWRAYRQLHGYAKPRRKYVRAK